MKLTQRQIRKLIQEELDAILDEVKPPKKEPAGIPPKHAPKGKPGMAPAGGEEELEKSRPKVPPSPHERAPRKPTKDPLENLEENDLYSLVQEVLQDMLK